MGAQTLRFCRFSKLSCDSLLSMVSLADLTFEFWLIACPTTKDSFTPINKNLCIFGRSYWVSCCCVRLSPACQFSVLTWCVGPISESFRGIKTRYQIAFKDNASSFSRYISFMHISITFDTLFTSYRKLSQISWHLLASLWCSEVKGLSFMYLCELISRISVSLPSLWRFNARTKCITWGWVVLHAQIWWQAAYYAKAT